MNEASRLHYELLFEVSFLRKRGQAFQDFFADIMERAHPGDFIRTRPWGNRGDKKNDGYLKSERMLFQVYAPNEISANEAVNKIDEDFCEALPFWEKYFDKWVFVHNSREGLGPDVLRKLLELEQEHSRIKTLHWGYEEIRERLWLCTPDSICGLLGPPIEKHTALLQPEPTGRLSVVSVNYMNSQFESFSKIITDDREADFNRLAEEWRACHGRASLQKLVNYREAIEWPLLRPELQSKFLRFEASLVLALDRDVKRAETLAKEARKLDPNANFQALDALIAYHREGNTAALLRVENPAAIDAWNVRLALLLELGSSKVVLDQFNSLPANVTPNAETLRILAMSLLEETQHQEARRRINEALAIKPGWFDLRFTSAVISYFGSIVPSYLAKLPKQWPAPTDPRFIRCDALARESLAEAENTLNQLLMTDDLEPDMRMSLEGWKLACLANQPLRQRDAQAYCKMLLEGNSIHSLALPWANARGYVQVTDGIKRLLYAFKESDDTTRNTTFCSSS